MFFMRALGNPDKGTDFDLIYEVINSNEIFVTYLSNFPDVFHWN